jgi:hypothetical protein
MQKHLYNFTFLLIFNSMTISQIPTASNTPNLLFPDNLDVLDNGCVNLKDGTFWTFIWSKIPNATSYHLYVIGKNSPNPVINKSNLTSPEYIDKSFQSYIANRYRRGWKWKVRAKINGKWSNWSEERVFDVEPLNTDCEELSIK